MKTTILALATALLVLSACEDSSTDGVSDRETVSFDATDVTDMPEEVSDAVPVDEEPAAPAVTVDDYLGTYFVTETCTRAGTDSYGDPRSGSVNDAYTATIARGPEDGRVVVENLFNSPSEATSSPASVDANTLTLIGDDVSEVDGVAVTFTGTGTRDAGGVVFLTYTMASKSTTGGPVDAQTTCEATMTPTG